ncbi:MAG: InlB B-repeat-containing protein [Clostridia bacterium]|nr:InlB B-repeat-containing protein [Clostridia bacterium]
MLRRYKNKRKIRIKYFIYVCCIFCIVFICNTILSTSMRYNSSINGEVIGYAKENRSTTYNVIFNANGGTGEMDNQNIKYGVTDTLAENTFSNSDSIFYEWNTKEDGTGISYDNKGSIHISSILEDNILNLYAMWASKAVEVNGQYYNTITEALNDNAIPLDKTETTVNVLMNIEDSFSIEDGMNVILDLHGNTLSNNSNKKAVITNKGILTVLNGTVKTALSDAATINNEGTGNITFDNARILMTSNSGKQAFYNNNGTAEIKGGSYFHSVSSIRATVHNLAYGKLKITNGTIISPNYEGVYNLGTMTIGTQNNDVDRTTVTIRGKTYGIDSTKTFDFYDGSSMGITDAFNDRGKIKNKEEGHSVTYKEEDVDGVTYIVAYLFEAESVTFDPNGGIVNEPSRGVETGNKIGTLPVPAKPGHIFDAWYTSKTGGEKITEDTIITSSITVYAQWFKKDIAKVNGVTYPTIQDAMKNIPANTKTTITLIADTQEYITVSESKDIVIDLNNYEFSDFDTKYTLIKNYGTVEIKNGTINTASENAAIDNEVTGKLIINNTSINATGQKQVVYNNGGNLEITGNSHLTSKTTGTPRDATLERGTIQNINNGKVTILEGIIECSTQSAVSNEGTLIIGVKGDGNIDTDSVVMVGKTYGIISLGTLSFYDGIAKGIIDSISGTIDDIEDDTQIKNDTEVIDSDTYKTTVLEINQ